MRWRLTACFLLVFGLLLVVIEWLDERALSALLDRVSQEDLAIKIEEVRAAARTSEPGKPLPAGITLDGTMVEIVSEGGQSLSRSSNLSAKGLPRPGKGPKTVSARQDPNGPVLVGSVRLGPNWGHAHALVGIPLDEFEMAKRHKRISGAIAFAVGLALSGIAAYLLSGLALRPVERMRRDVAAIEATDMSRRIDLEGLPHDELGRLAETFNNLLDRVAEASAEQHRFVQDASHDLKSPVAAIKGHAQLLLKRGRQDPALWERPLQAILREADRLTRLIEDLLLIADPSRGHEPIGRVDLEALVREVVADWQLLHDRVRLGPLAPAMVLTAPDHLRRILSNLLENAVRAVEGGGEVEVTLQRHDDGRVRLVVADTGKGIAEAQRARVFDRFYRADSSRSPGRGGNGLGLAIVKSLAEYHGGRVLLESEEGRGTQVSVEFPLAAPAWEAKTPISGSRG